MYSNKLVACVKADGKVLREKGEEVYLPFGSEYSLYFKNENNRKVQIDVEIDGQDVLDGKSLVLGAGENMDLKGYVKDICGDDNRAFKFITKTQEISDFRGDRAEDGLVKIKYTFEKERPVLRFEDYSHHDIYRTYTNCDENKQPFGTGFGGFVDSGENTTLFNNSDNISHNINDTMNVTYSTNSLNNSVDTDYVANNAIKSMDLGVTNTSTNVSDEPGITVEGSATGQSFKRGSIGILESKSHTMVFQLKGLTSEEIVQEPVTVKTKKQCPSCGKKYKSSYEYCPQDGTYLR